MTVGVGVVLALVQLGEDFLWLLLLPVRSGRAPTRTDAALSAVLDEIAVPKAVLDESATASSGM
jgi:hypothetical protein